jgi:uncharacterized protein YndB with AHSA1/START domain
MSDIPVLPAQFTLTRDRISARWSLDLDNHQEEVWTAITQPEWLSKWLAPGSIELRDGGAATLVFEDSGRTIDSKVTAFDQHWMLEYSWSCPGEPVRPLRWELEPIGPTTRLTLTLTVPAIENAACAAAGWAAHLDMLATALAGSAGPFPFELFKAARETYERQIAAQRASTVD